MRILLLGKDGQVGWELERALAPLGEILALGRGELDLARPEEIRKVVREQRPALILNAAAYTGVDQAEEEPELAQLVNAVAPGVFAEEARALGAGLVHYSTDYVFSGETGQPYTEEDEPSPLNMYGRTKLEGERAIQSVGGKYLIFRASWVYSTWSKCFVTKVLRWARERTELRFASNQIGSPTWSRLLAEATALVVSQGFPSLDAYTLEHAGIYHLAGAGLASRFDLAQEILRLDPRREEQIVGKVAEARSEEFPMRAQRPADSSLNCDRASDKLGVTLPDWRDSLRLAMEVPARSWTTVSGWPSSS